MINVYAKRWMIKTSLKNLNVDTGVNLIRYIQNNKVIRIAGRLVDEPRVLLCCYAIRHQPRTILSLDVFDYYLRYKARKLLEVLEALQKKYSLGCFVLFQLRFMKFKEYFNSWKQKDMLKLCVPMVHEYWELNALKEKYMHLKDDYMVIHEQQEMVVHRLRRINRNVDALLEKYKDNAPTLEETIANSFYERWIRDVYDDLNQQNYARVVPLIKDIRDMINELVPNNTEYQENVIRKLDVDLLQGMIDNTHIEGAYVFNMIMFVMQTIVELQSADMDQDTRMVIALLEDMFKKQFSYAQILTFFFQSAFQKLELIRKRKLDFLNSLSK